jgi:hypothetical protein
MPVRPSGRIALLQEPFLICSSKWWENGAASSTNKTNNGKETMSRISGLLPHRLKSFIGSTAEAWKGDQHIKFNSYGVEVLVAKRPGPNFEGADVYTFGRTQPNAQHDRHWYVENAHGKSVICLETGTDSHEAVRVWQGLVAELDGAYPWGGAVIDLHYGLVVSTSGFEEDEDILFSRTVRNFIVMWMDRDGQRQLDAARARGELPIPEGIDRFTHAVLLD